MSERTTRAPVLERPSGGLLSRTALAAALCAPLAPVPAQAQEDTREIFVELQKVKQQLQEIQQKALEHPEIQEDRAKFEEDLAAAIEEIDPQADEKRERLAELQTEMQQAQQAGNQGKVSSLMDEAFGIQEALQQVEAQAMSRGTLARSLERLQEKLLKRMKEIEPNVEELMQREVELTAKLQGG